jgi:hypothetical protein
MSPWLICVAEAAAVDEAVAVVDGAAEVDEAQVPVERAPAPAIVAVAVRM